MPQLLLVRHGEPELTGTLLGRKDPALSEEGRRAARLALGRLEGAFAYVSPLRRAQETAAFLPESIPRVTLPELAEICLGEWEGLKWSEVEERWPELAQQKLERWLDVPAPGGETRQQVFARAATVIERIRLGPLPAIVVAHHGINSVLSELASGCDPHVHKQAYCEVICHEF
ncbi:MAG TPA: histidine phosphatase family protein [Bryobacteraceae bacterium]|nr:histidine phosphatase family protein [Bryobacteraceae bacterium]